MKNDNIADHALYDTLIQKIAETDCKNKRLLSLSATISKSSFFKQGSENNIVAELEQEIRTAFGEVITCLRTYFISISK